MRNIQRIISHDDYDYPKKYNDIALFELDEKVKYSFLVHPACLWEFPAFSLTKKAKISGWGATDACKFLFFAYFVMLIWHVD